MCVFVSVCVSPLLDRGNGVNMWELRQNQYLDNRFWIQEVKKESEDLK